MSLKQWADNKWLREHRTSLQEIAGLLAIVDRDLVDAAQDISTDWRFGIAYNAALKLCTVVLYASGYRAEATLQHHRTIAALPLILGEDCREASEYLDSCRKKRNIVEYDMVGAVTRQDAEELILFARELRNRVLGWLRKESPELLPPDLR
jgi:hypothetical protein